MTGAVTPGYRGGRGEPLLLVHGAEVSWRVWAPVLDRLAERFDVHAPTLPGHRGGPPRPGPVGVEMFADFLEGYLDEHGLETVHVAGNSLGGILAVELVRRGRARSAVNFGGPSAAEDRERYETFYRRARAAARVGSVPLLGRALRELGARSPAFRRRMLAGGLVHADRMTRAEFENLMDDGAAADIGLALVRSVLDGVMLEPFEVGDVPTLVAWGTEDRNVSLADFGVASHHFARGSELRVLPHVAHIPTWDDPDAVVACIEETAARAGS